LQPAPLPPAADAAEDAPGGVLATRRAEFVIRPYVEALRSAMSEREARQGVTFDAFWHDDYVTTLRNRVKPESSQGECVL